MTHMETARVFAAVQFAAQEKREIAEVSEALRPLVAAGRLSRPELLHITLHFFGETPRGRFADIARAMEGAAARHRPFRMETSAPGMFGGAGGVLWLGVGQGAAELLALQADLEKELIQQGFPVENRPFRAHITLGREVRLKPGARLADVNLPPVNLTVESLALMESTRVSGRLAYVPLFSAELGHGSRLR